MIEQEIHCNNLPAQAQTSIPLAETSYASQQGASLL